MAEADSKIGVLPIKRRHYRSAYGAARDRRARSKNTPSGFSASTIFGPVKLSPTILLCTPSAPVSQNVLFNLEVLRDYVKARLGGERDHFGEQGSTDCTHV